MIGDGDMVRRLDGSGNPGQQDHNDGAIIKMAKQIASTEGVVIKTAFTGMLKYNELYGKFGDNLNKLFACCMGGLSTTP